MGFTSTAPVTGLKTSCDGTVEPMATVKIALAVVAGTPLIVSAVNALTTAVAPDVPLIAETVSGVATTGAAPTPTETVAVLQFVGFSISQI